ncbi:hypothetical protein EP7_005015 [Isosphaeraceae bacterium EP7]
MTRRKTLAIACLTLAATYGAAAPGAQAQPVVAAPYRAKLSIETALPALPGHPTQMAWGPRARLYVISTNSGITSYRYNWITGKLTSPVQALPSANGLGLAFHGGDLYYSSMDGSLWKANDANGNGLFGETGLGELKVALVTGIPIGDHGVDNIQIAGNTLYVGIGTRTINGQSGPLSSGALDDFGNQGFFSGGPGNTWGDSSYNGTIAWIKDLGQVVNATNSANAFNTVPANISQALIQDDSGPVTKTDAGKLVVHSAGTRNPFGLALDAAGQLFFTVNYNRAKTNGDGTTVQAHPKDVVGPDLSMEVSDQLFRAVPGADYGFANVNWRGKSPFLSLNADGPNRAHSITFDNLANPGPYVLHNPAQPVGLGPNASADGASFFYAAGLPDDLAGNLFIVRFNDEVTESSPGSRTLRYADLVAVDVQTGATKRVASQFSSPLAVLSDGLGRLLVADFGLTSNPGGNGAIYTLKVKQTR